MLMLGWVLGIATVSSTLGYLNYSTGQLRMTEDYIPFCCINIMTDDEDVVAYNPWYARSNCHDYYPVNAHGAEEGIERIASIPYSISSINSFPMKPTLTHGISTHSR